jgi:hypothetical protein
MAHERATTPQIPGSSFQYLRQPHETWRKTLSIDGSRAFSH